MPPKILNGGIDMELLIVLLKIGVIVSIAYLFSIYGYKYIKKTSTQDAQNVIHKIIREETAALTSNQTRMCEPVPNDTFIDAVLDILDKYNKLDKRFTKWQFNQNFSGFPAVCFNIVADADSNFQLLIAALETYVSSCLEEIRPAPLVYVYYTKYGDNRFHLYICYACYPSAQNALRNFVLNKGTVHEKQVLAKTAPVINQALEREIDEMNKGEQHGRL